jgi:CSLREA domain-containing protein
VLLAAAPGNQNQPSEEYTMTTHPFSSTPARAARLIVVALALMLVAAIVPLPAHAASIVVNDAGDTATGDCANPAATCTLRDAITFANSNAGADTITFSISNDTIFLGSTLPPISEDLTIDGTGKTMAIDGQNNVRIMETASSSLTLNVTALRLQRGNIAGFNYGGAILVQSEANLNVTGCIFDANVAGIAGGAIYAVGEGTLNVTSSTFGSNFANGQNGGAIWSNKGPTNITSSTFLTNYAIGLGGAIHYSSGTLTVSNSTFSGNRTTGSVGGGGAIAGDGGTVNIANSTFSGNHTAGSSGGGAIWNYQYAYLNVTNSTLSGNYTSGSGTGGGIHDTSTDSRMTLKNTIIANSTSGGDCVGTAKSPDSVNNLIEDGSNACGLTNGTNGNIVGADPNLAALADNGGPTQTMALGSGSAAINAGDTTVCAAAPVNNLDQRGYGRPEPSGTLCDIGAYEADGAPLAVTLAGFDAAAAADHVLVTWETVSELENAGFNLYGTATADRPTAADLLAFVPSLGPGSTQGFAYSHQDYAVTAGQTYWYWLEDVDLNGATTLHGPVSVVFVAPTAVTLSGLAASSPTPLAGPWWLVAVMAAALAAAAAVVWRRRKMI